MNKRKTIKVINLFTIQLTVLLIYTLCMFFGYKLEKIIMEPFKFSLLIGMIILCINTIVLILYIKKKPAPEYINEHTDEYIHNGYDDINYAGDNNGYKE